MQPPSAAAPVRGQYRLSRRGAVAVTTAAATLVSLAGAFVSSAPGAAVPPSREPVKAVTCVTDRPDELSAALTARLCQGRVEVAGQRTETKQVFANADGSFTAQVHREPVRTRQHGRWVPVDLTLHVQQDGSVAPAAHPGGLRVAAAGTGTRDIASVDINGDRIGMTWTGTLPTPVLDGAKATYPEVKPGVDLVVEATRGGFEQFLIVKNRAAVAQVAKVRIDLRGAATTFEPQPGGGVLLKNRHGRKVGYSPTPLMWDAATTPSGEPARLAKVPTPARTRAQGRLTLLDDPDRSWLNAAERVFPITIDPQVTALALSDTYVKEGVTIDHSAASDLHVGYGGGIRARSLVQWDASPFVGKQVTAAKVSLWNWYSASCTPSSWDIWTLDPPPVGVIWTTQPAWRHREASSTQTHGYSTSCNDNWSDIDARSFFQRAADAGDAAPWMGIRATTESDPNSWKQFRSRNAPSASQVPLATVTYNNKPTVASVSTGPPTPCTTGSARPHVNTKTPTLKATVTDADGSTVKARFQWWTGGSMIGEALYPGGTLASGSTFTTTVPAGAFAEGGTYAWRVLGDDGLTEGPFSGWCEFTVDTAAPTSAPVVNSAAYPADAWTDSAGRPGSFTFESGGVTDVATYLYGLDTNPPTTAVNPTALGGSAAVPLTPTTPGPHTVYVRSQDRAGNLSPLRSYVFYVGSAAVTAPVDGDTTARDVVLSAAAPSGTSGVTFQYRRSDLDAWTDIPAADVRRRSDSSAITWPVAMSSSQSPELVWTATSTLADNALLQVRAVLASAGSLLTAPPVRLTVDRNAAGAATEDVGPGSLNLVTGDYRLEDVDAAEFGMSISRVASSRNPTVVQGGQAQIFGPQWSWRYSTGGAANVSSLTRTATNAVEISTGTGNSLRFVQSTGGRWRPEPGAERLSLAYTAADDTFTLSDVTSAASVTFGAPFSGLTGYPVVSSSQAGANSTIVYVHERVSVGGVARVRLTRVIAPSTAVASTVCAADPATRGCRVLELLYPHTTTASGTAFGDVAGQVSTMRLWSTAPNATAGTSVDVARYAYDSTGALREQWDPRISPALKTAYTYDGGRVTTLTPPGEQPWTFAYGTAGALPTSGPGMLLSAGRPTLRSGTADQVDGAARTTIVYDVPTTLTLGGPYELGGTEVQKWGQTAVPMTAVAVFPPDAVPAGNVGRGALTSGSYARADVSYLDRNGRLTNAAAPGGHLTAMAYDRLGHLVSLLPAGNRALALGQGPDAGAQLAGLGLTAMSTAQRATLLSTVTAYSSDGVAKIDELGPLHLTTLTRPLAVSGGLPTLPAGSVVAARAHTVSTLDTGRPTDAKVARQVTGTVSAGSVLGYGTDADQQRRAFTYDWRLGLVTSTTDDPSGQPIVRATTYDEQGRVTSQREPGADGTDASTTVTAYYTAGGSGTCGGRPEWADLECRTGPAGRVTGAADDVDELVTKTIAYERDGAVAVVTETANDSTRVTTIGYDAAQRETTRSVTGGVGAAVPATATEYSPVNGRVLRTGDRSTGWIVTEYDTLGRLIRYTDAAGSRTTYTYDALDRKTSETDAAGTTRTYAYDVGVDPRGLLTATTDSVAGTFRATYDANGAQVMQSLPGGVTQRTTVDQVGMPTAVQYTTSAGEPIFTDRIGTNAQGQWLTHTGFSTQTFTVDALGRVVQVDDLLGAACTRRIYRYGAQAHEYSNRVAQGAATGEPGAGCPAVPGTTAHTYDSANRIIDDGYSYDAFGRTTALPGGMTVDYYGDHQVHRQTVGDRRQIWTTDPAGREASFTVEARADGGWQPVAARSNHYRDGDDRPDYIVEDVGTGRITRNVAGTDGRLAAVTSGTGDLRLQLTNLHGDVSVVFDPATAVADVQVTDEYGVVTSGTAGGRYGYLGGEQRSREALGGTVLMGARVYDPATGRFLQTDPIVGGNANPYDYCSGDPNSCNDTSGLGGCIWYVICGRVSNNSGKVMRAGEIVTRGSNATCDTWNWGQRTRPRCKVRDVRRNGGRLGGWGYDVDVFTFPGTHFFFWGAYLPKNRYVKFSTGLHIHCNHGSRYIPPICS